MSTFAESVQGLMLQSMSPDRQLTKSAMQGFVQQQAQDTEALRIETLTKIEDALEKAKARTNPSQAVIDAYERMLQRVSSAA